MLSWRSAAPAPVFRAKWQAPKPHVNTAFVTDLLDMADTWRIRVGEMLLGFYLERGLASNKTVPEEYYECELANRLQVPMRLTGRGQRWPLYSYPRLARYAFFTGTGLELDFPASHGQQFLKYARRQLAFGSTEAIYEFRRTACDVTSSGTVSAPQLFASNTLTVTNTSDFSDDLFLTKNWAGWSKLQVSNNSAAPDSGPELRLLGNQSARVFLETAGRTSAS